MSDLEVKPSQGSRQRAVIQIHRDRAMMSQARRHWQEQATLKKDANCNKITGADMLCQQLILHMMMIKPEGTMHM